MTGDTEKRVRHEQWIGGEGKLGQKQRGFGCTAIAQEAFQTQIRQTARLGKIVRDTVEADRIA